MLEGRLNEFRLGDVFQLLAWTHKSGSLTVDAGDRTGRVDFSDGKVVFALADVRRAELGARLVATGTVGDDTLLRLVEAQQAGPGRVAEVLAGEGLDEALVDQALREHVQDAVFTLLRTADGGFTFSPSADEADVPGPRLDTEVLIEEGARRLDEWQQVRERIPSAAAVLGMAPTPPETDGHIRVTPDQWRLLVLVDGRRTVADLVDLLGQGEYATSQVLAELVEAGLVEAVDPADGGTALADLLARRDSLRRMEESELGAPVEPAARSEEVPPAPVESADEETSAADDVETLPVAEEIDEPDTVAGAASAEAGVAEPVFGFGPATAEEPTVEGEAEIFAWPAPEEPASESASDDEPARGQEAAHPAWQEPVSPLDEEAYTAEQSWAGEEPVGAGVGADEPMFDAPAYDGVADQELEHDAPPSDAPAYDAVADQELEHDAPAADAQVHVEAGNSEAAPVQPWDGDQPAAATPGSVDRAQVARELASLGFEDGPASSPATTAPTTEEPPRRLTRDEDVTRGLLVRLMDGVRKA